MNLLNCLKQKFYLLNDICFKCQYIFYWWIVFDIRFCEANIFVCFRKATINIKKNISSYI